MVDEMNILLVEDNDLDVEILKRAIDKLEMGISVVRARDGIEALDILKSDAEVHRPPHPFVILLDINMPRMTGHEFLDELRAVEEISSARVFVFTTSSSQKDINLAYKRNVGGYIVKPRTSPELKELIVSLQDFWERCENPVLGGYYHA